MPRIDAAAFGGLVLHLIVPQAQLLGAGGLLHHADDARMVHQIAERFARHPDVDHLPHRRRCILAHVGQAVRLGLGLVVLIGQDTRQLGTQDFDLGHGQHLTGVEQPFALV